MAQPETVQGASRLPRYGATSGTTSPVPTSMTLPPTQAAPGQALLTLAPARGRSPPGTTTGPSPYTEPNKDLSTTEVVAPYLSEFLGTFFFVFTTACCASEGNRFFGYTAMAFSYVALSYCTAHTDALNGGVLNPAISVSMWLTRKWTLCNAVFYVVLQLFGGILGGLCATLVMGVPAAGSGPIPPFTLKQAALSELLFTAMLCFVASNVLAAKRNNPDGDKNQFSALAIGFALIASSYASSRITGTAINPAVTIGLDVGNVFKADVAAGGFLFAIIELIGGAIGALLFRLSRPEDFSESFSEDGGSLGVKVFAEFLGTFFLVLTFGLNTVLETGATAWATAGVVASMTYAVSNISGAHFNPAVTTAVALSGRGKCSRRDAIAYVVAQLITGALAGLLVRYFHHHGPTSEMPFGLLLENLSQGGSSWTVALCVEFVFTAIVCLTVLTADTSVISGGVSRTNFYFGLAIGFAVAAGIYAACKISGGYLNPAVALGMDLQYHPANHHNLSLSIGTLLDALEAIGKAILLSLTYLAPFVLYAVFEVCGGMLASIIFRLTHPGEFKPRMPLMMYPDLQAQP